MVQYSSMKRGELRQEAKRLRAKGLTYREIISSLGISIPRSTLSYWFREVHLALEYQERIKKIVLENGKKARQKAWASHVIKRQNLVEKIRGEHAHFTHVFKNRDVAKIALTMLYLGEGAKWQGHRGLMLGSSDPIIVILYIKLLKICYQIDKESLRCRISYRSDQNIEELEKFWSQILGITRKNFYKTKADPRTVGKKTANINYKGVCVITCAGTHIQIELEEIAKILSGKKGP